MKKYLKNENVGYDINPVHPIEDGKIHCGFAALADALSGEKTVMLDLFEGVDSSIIRTGIDKELSSRGIRAVWHEMSKAMKPEDEIRKMTEPFLGGDDPIFGFRARLSIKDYFDPGKLEKLRGEAREECLNIFIGPGAALIDPEGCIVYVDLPKNELQLRSRAGKAVNLGISEVIAPKPAYKRFYFVDWVVLESHKKEILPAVKWYADAVDENHLSFMAGDDLRKALKDLSGNALRVKPWFEPGVWGGQWMKEHFKGLRQDVKNYAWSFELIVPENGIVFGSGGNCLEVSFSLIMFQQGREVVGEDCFGKYGYEFPIRLDYLDNIGGGNLSIQCHPRKEFIQKNFGEVLTQEETYYIMQCTDDAVVYLGFNEDIEPEKFEKALRESYQNCTKLDVDKYIHHEKAFKHGLFLIPPGTLHSSGRGNLVLEISTTPYIFTFKMYDWLALDLDGRPRPLNIDRAMANLYFDRKGERMHEEFVSKPSVIAEGKDWKVEHVPTHANHSYDVNRFHVCSEFSAKTGGKCHVLNMVDGVSARIITESGGEYHISYGESLIVCAACGSYTIINESGDTPAMFICAFMKD